MMTLAPNRLTEHLKKLDSLMTQTHPSCDALESEDADLHEELLYLFRHSDPSTVSSLLTEYPNLDLTTIMDENGNTLLHMVAGNGHLEMIQLLIQTILEYEQRMASTYTTEVIITSPNNRLLTYINTPNSSKNTPLHWAALNNHLDIVQYLYSQSADPLLKNEQGRTALEEAEGRGWEGVAKYLAAKMAIEVKRRGIEFDKYVLQDGEEEQFSE